MNERLLELCWKYGIELTVYYDPIVDGIKIHARKRVFGLLKNCVFTVGLKELQMARCPDNVWERVAEKFYREFELDIFDK